MITAIGKAMMHKIDRQIKLQNNLKHPGVIKIINKLKAYATEAKKKARMDKEVQTVLYIKRLVKAKVAKKRKFKENMQNPNVIWFIDKLKKLADPRNRHGIKTVMNVKKAMIRFHNVKKESKLEENLKNPAVNAFLTKLIRFA